MANLFDDANAPETEPATIVAGDQVKWKRTDLGTDYPNTAYSLRYSSRLEGTGSTTFDVASADSGDDYLMTTSRTAPPPVSVPASITGSFTFCATATARGLRSIVAPGRLNPT